MSSHDDCKIWELEENENLVKWGCQQLKGEFESLIKLFYHIQNREEEEPLH